MRHSLFLSALLWCGISACDKNTPGTQPPADDAGATTGGATAAPDVPQEPDPPQIAEGAEHYVFGRYQDAIATLQPVYEDLKARNQYRASGLAGGWLALAHAKDVFERGEEPVQHSLAMADKTTDPEVVAVAKLAHGAFLLSSEDYEAAERSFAAAASAGPDVRVKTLAEIMRAEALINRAFGSANSTEIQNPQDLESAKTAYASAAKSAEAEGTPILRARAEEGLAAVAKYQRKGDAICTHAAAALEHYKSAGASEDMLAVPMDLAREQKCKLPDAS